MNKTKVTAPSVPFSLEEHLKDPEVKAAYEVLEGEFALVRQLVDLRQKRGLTQRELAKRAGMQQPVIARLEGGRPASLGTLRRVAAALDAQVEVRLVPRANAANESLQASAKVNSRNSVRLLHDALFDAVLQTMIDSNFDMFKRINDNEDFGRAVREKIFEQVYRELLEQSGIEP